MARQVLRSQEPLPPEKVPIELFSFGEDSTRVSWKLELGADRGPPSPDGSPASLDYQLGTLNRCGAPVTCHAGKNVWSVAVLDTQDNDPLTASGVPTAKFPSLGRLPQPFGANHLPGVITAGSEYLNQTESLTVAFDEILTSLKRSSGARPGSSFSPLKKNEKDAFQNYAFLSRDIPAAHN